MKRSWLRVSSNLSVVQLPTWTGSLSTPISSPTSFGSLWVEKARFHSLIIEWRRVVVWTLVRPKSWPLAIDTHWQSLLSRGAVGWERRREREGRSHALSSSPNGHTTEGVDIYVDPALQHVVFAKNNNKRITYPYCAPVYRVMDLTCTVCQVMAGPLTPSHTERRCSSVTWVIDRPHGLLHHRMEMIQSNGHKPTTSILIGHESSVCVCLGGGGEIQWYWKN